METVGTETPPTTTVAAISVVEYPPRGNTQSLTRKYLPLLRKAAASGFRYAKGDVAPQDMFWGDRMCKLTDPAGHVWNFATNVADFDPSKMPK